MKNRNKLSVLLLAVVVAFIYVGCASEPTQEITDANAAIEAAVQGGAQTYTQDELKALQDEYTAVVDEAKAKTGKLFKSNDEAKQKLIKIKENADALITKIAEKKAEAKENALNAQKEAEAAITEAKDFVANAPKGKGTQADIEAFNTDLTALTESLPEIQKLIEEENFLGAVEKCNTIKEKANGISEQIKQAQEKTATK